LKLLLNILVAIYGTKIIHATRFLLFCVFNLNAVRLQIQFSALF